MCLFTSGTALRDAMGTLLSIPEHCRHGRGVWIWIRAPGSVGLAPPTNVFAKVCWAYPWAAQAGSCPRVEKARCSHPCREAGHAGVEGPCLDVGSSPPAAERLISRTNVGAAISARQGLIVTFHFKILPDCLGTLFLWWFSHEWERCCDPLNGISITPTGLAVLGGQGPPNLSCWAHLHFQCLASQLPRCDPAQGYCLGERNETMASAPVHIVGTHLVGPSLDELFPELEADWSLQQVWGQGTMSWKSRWQGQAQALAERPHLCLPWWEGCFILSILEQWNPLILLTLFSLIFFQTVLAYQS